MVETEKSYDRVAAKYTKRIFDELKHKPVDRRLLEQFADEVRTAGPVCDLGCGPGHVARYLYQQGVDTFGLDISEEMLRHARQLNPEIQFKRGDMLNLKLGKETLAGIVAFYSLIHVPRDQMVRVLSDFRGALKPEGILLISFHIGTKDIHLDEWWEESVNLDFAFFEVKEMKSYLAKAQFSIQKLILRRPYPENVEHQSERGYFLVRKN